MPMLPCVQIHKIPWDPSSSLKPLDIKHHIISVLRFEMRWMAKKWMKEFDVILRTDTELADKVLNTFSGVPARVHAAALF